MDRRAYAGCTGPLRPTGGLGLHNEGESEWEGDGLDDFLSEHLLGGGGLPLMPAQVMEGYYRDEQEFRVLL